MVFLDYRQFFRFQVLFAMEGYCKYFSVKIQKLKLKFTKDFRKIFLRNTCEGTERNPYTEIFHQYSKNISKYRTLIFSQNIDFQALTCIFWQKNTVSRNAGEEKKFHPSSRQFSFFNRFSKDIIFSSLISFAFLCILFVVVVAYMFVSWN